ncbi:MAG: bifunctional 5,10-methylenetetrahydrofolate dehydrogenase/5,10-methenyltetrahydrofolate cyclohydrolase [Candidatus Nomurabacteria bacterium]|jgi:methylenetetrahydrofolate dehydrogenase (NADP+)/methenyltetrahydrofolate cyclohydrolase|nr:bifunctional 5,10-methylenetetrahydrofolate dehydrogenase/5,10-methenyltetrahydrofolate cyclohydrolase [Candidatus Nomurabacteria bacterium]
MKFLNGNELVGFIKQRQAHQVRGLIQHDKIQPKLAIITTKDDPVINIYMDLKKAYGADILIDAEIFRVGQGAELEQKIAQLNADQFVTGIILQLPLENPAETDQYVTKIDPRKDVDGLGSDQFFVPATAMAVDWLVNGYNIELLGKKIAIVGQNGRLVGRPLMKLWEKYQPTGFGRDDDLRRLRTFDIVVSATGSAAVIKPEMLGLDAVLIDAGTVSENGKIVGDADPSLYNRQDLTITPPTGGVGPLTVAALFDNVIKAARLNVDK